MTKCEFVEKMVDFSKNYYSKYHYNKVRTYKYRGEIKTSTVPTLTEEGKALMDMAHSHDFLFTCPCCKKQVPFGQLEYWDESVETVLANHIICASCYEDEMDEDL